uniref:Uncharacterized protein n=1 Tax=Rhizophagus irregularis (strain DAOM 181602 / DAOM 197198 / MUCL 43194) TaxID=747089 RepID=U9UTG3_RHIID
MVILQSGGIGTQQKENAQSKRRRCIDDKRMKEISNNEKATSSRTCNKDNVDSEDDNLNENKKRIMKSHLFIYAWNWFEDNADDWRNFGRLSNTFLARA